MKASRDHALSTCAAGSKQPAPQPLYCEMCDADATADDWISGLLAVLCPTCLENLMDAPKETL